MPGNIDRILDIFEGRGNRIFFFFVAGWIYRLWEKEKNEGWLQIFDPHKWKDGVVDYCVSPVKCWLIGSDTDRQRIESTRFQIFFAKYNAVGALSVYAREYLSWWKWNIS
jgi:hypothetical protein